MSARIHSIDAIRGFCLLNIFVNHITVGVLQGASPSNIGLSDSADMFVLLAGVSAALAASDKPLMQVAGAFWRRALVLYSANLGVIGGGVLLLVGLSLFLDIGVLLDGELLRALVSVGPFTAIWHLVSLQQPIGYSLVLRLYVALMVLAPALLWLTRKRWWLALPVAAGIWLTAGQFGLVVRESLTGLPITMTILPWTLIFACGMAIGAAWRQGVRIRPSSTLLAAAVSIVVGYIAFLWLAQVSPEAQAWLTTRNENFWLGASKTYQSPLRVLHLLSLAYIFVALPKAPILRLIHGVSSDNLLVRLGRRSLPVFVFGAIAAPFASEMVHLANRTWGTASLPAVGIELALVAVGIAGMARIARAGSLPAWLKWRPAPMTPACQTEGASGRL